MILAEPSDYEEDKQWKEDYKKWLKDQIKKNWRGEMNYRQGWAEGDIEAGTLLDVIEELQSEVESLKERLSNRATEHMDDLALMMRTEVETERFRGVLKEIAEYPSNDAIEIRRIAKYSLENSNV